MVTFWIAFFLTSWAALAAWTVTKSRKVGRSFSEGRSPGVPTAHRSTANANASRH